MSPKDVDVNVMDKKVVYTIKKPSRDQSGKYTIKMSNKAGSSTKDVKINMQDKPSPPTTFEVSHALLLRAGQASLTRTLVVGGKEMV